MIYSFKKKYKLNFHKNKKPFIVPVFIPNMGCYHRCVFCEQKTITGMKITHINTEKIIQNIKLYLKYRSKNRSVTQIAFYGGNFFGLDRQNIFKILNLTIPFITDGFVDSIRFSTRPDTVNSNSLSLIKSYPVKTIELGVQSMNDEVLALSNRGHNSEDTNHAVAKIKSANYDVGIQLMIGLPGDDQYKSMETAEKIAALDPKFIRIYPTIVIENSMLANMYKKKVYVPMRLDDSVALTKKIFLFFQNKGIPVIRMGLQATKILDSNSKIVAGPYHPSFGHMVYSSIFLDVTNFFLSKKKFKLKSIVIGINPKNISRLQGLNFINIKYLKSKFSLNSITIKQRTDLSHKHLDIFGYLVKIY